MYSPEWAIFVLLVLPLTHPCDIRTLMHTS
jgi:hypothetical protein